jgi:hypothetical protein
MSENESEQGSPGGVNDAGGGPVKVDVEGGSGGGGLGAEGVVGVGPVWV